MSQPGAIEPPEVFLHEDARINQPDPVPRSTGGGLEADDGFFLPDFCDPRMVLAVVLVSELLAVMLALARSTDAAFLTELARISVFVQWLGLTSAGVLCAVRPRLLGCSIAAVTLRVFALLLANTALLSVAVIVMGDWMLARGLGRGLFPAELWPFLARNLGISLIAGALLLRYFFVSHQWRHHVRAEARSRIHALQARIRPHFLFNSMNTIASLTRSDPARAEEAVEDLADLFRATLRDTDMMLSLKEELELTRIYQRIESLRLGDRLSVRWNVSELPMRASMPGLTLQPLLENAIYHGIERLDHGGTVEISGHCDDGVITISVANPVAESQGDQVHHGNKLAIGNIRERLELAYGDQGTLKVEESGREYRVTIGFPMTQ